MLDAIDLITTWVRDPGGVDIAIADAKTRSAVERQLLVISEAAIRLNHLDTSIAPRIAPEIDWPGVRGMGNFIRHKYDDIDLEIIVDVVNNRLDALRAACVRGLANA